MVDESAAEGERLEARLQNFLRDGRLVRLPAKFTTRKATLRYLAMRDFKPRTWYDEREVNELLKAWCEGADATDYVSVRRYLIDCLRSAGHQRNVSMETEGIAQEIDLHAQALEDPVASVLLQYGLDEQRVRLAAREFIVSVYRSVVSTRGVSVPASKMAKNKTLAQQLANGVFNLRRADCSDAGREVFHCP